ncbi:hypothetical protein GCM10011613_22370 [Cellvibrio zantedeschiae]|uniref:Uncharacterized protein n=1 Tax=Cellvibrio zantedeschiae TaxID=1237077 RepID=A0ABQ3B3K4_9GAMM|nr:hypothetical protein [Cellvibrio zantedeschiae]GGY77360.1 hypothetical protein GCM10011613_22370 [Cellvibrio zantedeschiae]
MKINHRVTLSVDERIANAFFKIGLVLNVGFTTFDIDEQDERWPAVSVLIESFKGVDIVASSFEKEELNSAHYLEMIPDWHHGYPEPSDDASYKDKTYDMSNCCQLCNTGYVQNNPFRMRKNPGWGQRSILQLNWIFGDYFVQPDVWHSVFSPFGINRIEVVSNKTLNALTDILQLEISNRVAVRMTEENKYEVCLKCGAKKYLPHSRGFFPPVDLETDTPIFKTEQWFGSGGSAWQAVIVSAALYRAIVDSGIRGVRFKPLANAVV